MKKFYTLICLLVSLTVFSQPSIKIYAYAQPMTPGIVPVDENGRPIRKEPLVNYFFYAVFSPSYNIKFDGIWIKGKAHSVQTSKVDVTPVTVTNHEIPSDPVTTVLVPATKSRVIAIQPISASNTTVNARWFRDMLNKNELIISYFYKGKKYFIPVRKIKVLPTVAGV